jgi:hypothetical protein
VLCTPASVRYRGEKLGVTIVASAKTWLRQDSAKCCWTTDLRCKRVVALVRTPLRRAGQLAVVAQRAAHLNRNRSQSRESSRARVRLGGVAPTEVSILCTYGLGILPKSIKGLIMHCCLQCCRPLQLGVPLQPKLPAPAAAPHEGGLLHSSPSPHPHPHSLPHG